MGCPEQVKIGQRWRYYRTIVEVTQDDPHELHGRVVAILPGNPDRDYYVGRLDYWVSNVTRGYGGDWEYLDGQDRPVS
jgi:hypothetical protein